MADLTDLNRQLEAKTERVANIVAREVERELKLEAPIDSGFLRSQITTAVRQTASGARIDLRSGADYAQFNQEHRAEWDEMVRSLPGRIERAWRATQ